MRSKKNIVAFCCENSGFKAARSVSKHRIMRSVEVVRVPCSGNIESRLILQALEEGARKILVACCPLDNCNYINGNQRAIQRIKALKKKLETAGIDGAEIRIEMLSSLDGHKLTAVLEELEQEHESSRRK